MIKEAKDPLVLAFTQIAKALEGLHDELRKAGTRYWPQPKPQREVVVSRIENDEDRAKKSLGEDGKEINEWLDDLGDPEGEDPAIIGERTRKWIEEHKETPKVSAAGTEVASGRKSRGAGAKKTKH